MPLSLDQCIKRVEEVYPGMHPTHWVQYDGKYIFNIVTDGSNRAVTNVDLHMVNPDDGGVSGSIPLNILSRDNKLIELLKKPNEIRAHRPLDIEHQIKKSPWGGYYAVIRSGSELSHHGIKGQKWGVRRFQNEDGSLTKEGRERYGYSIRSKKTPAGPQGMDPVTAYYASEAAALALFCIGTSIYAKVKRNSNHKEWKKQNDAISEDYISDISEIKEFSESSKPKSIVGVHDRESDMAAVNPKYGQNIKGNANNCVLCSVTYDLRRRGYDVTSKLCSTGMYSDKVVNEIYDNAKMESAGGLSWTSVAKRCEKKYPEGSRGIISINCAFGGHAMAFEINNGKMEVYDAQSAKKVKLTDPEFSIFDPQYTQTVRLDNKTIKWPGVSVACAELKNDWKKTISAQKKTQQTSTDSESTSDRKIAAGNKLAMNARQILAYKKEHPGTKLTDKEILKNILGG